MMSSSLGSPVDDSMLLIVSHYFVFFYLDAPLFRIVEQEGLKVNAYILRLSSGRGRLKMKPTSFFRTVERMRTVIVLMCN